MSWPAVLCRSRAVFLESFVGLRSDEVLERRESSTGPRLPGRYTEMFSRLLVGKHYIVEVLAVTAVLRKQRLLDGLDVGEHPVVAELQDRHIPGLGLGL